MERADLNVTEFVFDEESLIHIARHDVYEADIREVLENSPQFFINPPSSERTATHLMLGPNQAGRFLLAAIIQVEGTIWRPITAHWFHARLARRFYTEGG
jgi:hypothetical protein